MLALITELLAATADVHSPRVLARQVASTLSRHVAISRLELHAPAVRVELFDGRWRFVDGGPPCTHVLADGVRVTPRGALPSWCADADIRAALAQVVAAASRHLEVVQKVAKLSRRAHAKLREHVEPEMSIVAESPAMRALLVDMERVARHPTSVLVTGESGTGKELIARALHRASPRAHRPLVVVDGSAIATTLVESELFGHERGAFTGAERTHRGAFERAQGGTVFLDEIGELPPVAQAKLLRVLQERSIRRVGAEAELAVDVRVIAATNRDLRAAVTSGTFREDLYYRLDVVTLHVPPLRERIADLAPLAATLLARLARKLGTPPLALTPQLLSRLARYDWPGNVRELANVLERSLVLGAVEIPERPRVGFDAAVGRAIEEALRTTRGKIYGRDGAARLLGLPPATLQSKMKKLGISRARFAHRG